MDVYWKKGRNVNTLKTLKLRYLTKHMKILFILFLYLVVDMTRNGYLKGKKAFCGDYAKLIPNLCVLSFVSVAVCGVNIAKHQRNIH